MSFAAFLGGAMRPTVDQYRMEQRMKANMEQHAASAKLDKAMNEWEFYSPGERSVVAADLDKILKQKKGYTQTLLGQGEQGYKFLQGALAQQKPIQDLEAASQRVAARPINLQGQITAPESLFNKGNIDLGRQPIVQNPNGTSSTVDSSSYNINGKEVLLPSVTPGGQHLVKPDGTPDEKAILAEYDKTGRHLGQFNSIKESNDYADQLHEDYAQGKYNPIQLPSQPVKLPPLPIEGANIPRVDQRVLSMRPADRMAIAGQYAKDQMGMMTRSAKIAEINASSMDEDAKQLAIEALMGVPPGVLAMQQRKYGAGGSAMGLNVMEFESPDGTQRRYVQATRDGRGFVDAKTFQPLHPDELAGWQKVYNQPVQLVPNTEGTMDAVNKQRLGRKMNQGASLTGNLPDIHPREQLIPETSPTGKIQGLRGSTTGRVVNADAAAGAGAGGSPRYKGAMSEATQSTIGQISTLQASIDRLTQPGPDGLSPIDKHKDKIGFFRGNLEKGLAEIGGNIPGTEIGGDPEVDDIIGEMKTMKNTYIYLNTGKQLNEAESKRLAAVVPDFGQPYNRMKNNMARFARTLAIIRQVREMGGRDIVLSPDGQQVVGGGASDMELAAADSAAPASQAPARSAAPRQAAPTAAPQAPTTSVRKPPANPKVGDHWDFGNGKIGVFDGKGWKKVNPPSQ